MFKKILKKFALKIAAELAKIIYEELCNPITEEVKKHENV